MLDMGRPKEYARAMTITIPVRIPKATRKELELRAAMADRPLAWVIRSIIHDDIARRNGLASYPPGQDRQRTA